MMKAAIDWQVYRTRFLIKAKQLSEPLFFVDALGREHRGQKGDYLVESSDGMRRIAPREIFEDVYVAMGSVERSACSLTARKLRQTFRAKTAALQAAALTNLVVERRVRGLGLQDQIFGGSRVMVQSV